jgi:hypothetical protein
MSRIVYTILLKTIGDIRYVHSVSRHNKLLLLSLARKIFESDDVNSFCLLAIHCDLGILYVPLVGSAIS